MRVWDVDKKAMDRNPLFRSRVCLLWAQLLREATLMTFPDFEVPVAKVRFHPDGLGPWSPSYTPCGHAWTHMDTKWQSTGLVSQHAATMAASSSGTCARWVLGCFGAVSCVNRSSR